MGPGFVVVCPIEAQSQLDSIEPRNQLYFNSGILSPIQKSPLRTDRHLRVGSHEKHAAKVLYGRLYFDAPLYITKAAAPVDAGGEE